MSNIQLASDKSMIKDGWVKETMFGRSFWIMRDPSYTLIGSADTTDGYLEPEVVEKLSSVFNIYKVHSSIFGITTVELL